ncbi:MAG: hypothetical protein WC404_03335 [Candidatus Omnitrophota bacterium]|jgi:hypothetical protein
MECENREDQKKNDEYENAIEAGKEAGFDPTDILITGEVIEKVGETEHSTDVYFAGGAIVLSGIGVTAVGGTAVGVGVAALPETGGTSAIVIGAGAATTAAGVGMIAVGADLIADQIRNDTGLPIDVIKDNNWVP